MIWKKVQILKRGKIQRSDQKANKNWTGFN